MKRRLLWGWVTLALSFAVACSDGSENKGTGGTGGEDDKIVECVATQLCLGCPRESETCASDAGCGLGSQCLISDCADDAGASIRTCMQVPNPPCSPAERGGACPKDRECMDLSEQYGVEAGSEREDWRCVKVTPGCNSRFDCPVGYECEESTEEGVEIKNCINRRVPCQLNQDCPMSHSCVLVEEDAQICVRVHQPCITDRDCLGYAPLCADIDGDGNKECAPALDPNAYPPVACVNETCGGEAPVCEFSASGSEARCGQYGPCDPEQPACAEGFDCVALWLDGRSECVPQGGSCSHISDCPPRQVCASARTGGPASCQAGYSE